MNTRPVYADCHRLTEDDRINLIGQQVMVRQKVAVVLVDNEPGKAERYIAKLKSKWPEIRLGEVVPGVVKGTLQFSASPPAGRN